MLVINSKSNQGYKNWLGARQRKGQLANIYLLEGQRLCQELLRNDLEVDVKGIIVSESALSEKPEIIGLVSALELKFGIVKTIFADFLFKNISETKSPQGIIVGLKFNKSIELSSCRRVLVLEHLQDPGNLGAIWRSAAAFNFDAVLLTDNTVKPSNAKVIRSAMGAVFQVPVQIYSDIQAIYKDLQNFGFKLVATDLNGEVLGEGFNLKKENQLALVIGNEGRGLSDYALKNADYRVLIPISSKAESLNAACAASIFCYLLAADIS